METDNIIRILQASISPVVLISGIGLLLLSMTNRFGRVVDRSRILGKEMRNADEADKRKIRRQLRLLYRRAKLLRTAIIAASASILLVAVIILALFAEAVLGIPLRLATALLFAGCIIALIISMIIFLRDLTVSLHALWVEIKDQV